MTVDQVKSALTRGVPGLTIEDRPRQVGVREPVTVTEVWAEIDREGLLPAVAALKAAGPLHISIISGRDKGSEIELLYHFAVGYGTPGGEVMVTLRLNVPASDPTVPSICALLPGAETTEREKIEFLGIQFTGIPSTDHVFLPDGFPGHPWRKGDPETEKLVKRLVEWEGKDA
ncbi:MAG TPA: NADH-quinone oxidoreductase subunit C [Candidatus Bipolaricaulis sp.]|nr:NADH-quinone oxidoreductase subunit C [Candidatus Bipolaricaulis sp.]HRS14079.1 NADH-quinone oxidoreductase subunit C [Candidatus Bipolaricaulis sp.]HRU21848.1 NADH-quinone oxidoreductase subunit C [Candidatus Bipolaricaulis sp.]